MVGDEDFNLFETMNLRMLLSYIPRYIGKLEKKGFLINIEVNNKKINAKGLSILYLLLNSYEDFYFITIKDLPYCLMPDATEHIVYKKAGGKKYCYDKICKDCCFMNICPGWQKFLNIDRKKIPPPKSIPREIVIEVTTRCNLNCRTCTLDKSKSLNVTLKTAKGIMDDCKALGIKAVRFTGGEPILNRDIGKMLKLAKENNFYVLFNTNATAITSSALKLLEKNVDNVLISLQGFNQKTDRILTGSNVDFNRKIANIIRLKARIPITRVGTVISKTLITNLDKYYRLLKRIGIDNWELYRPMVKSKTKEFEISKKDLIKVMRFLFVLKNKGMKVKIANPLPFCITKDINLALTTLLGAGADDGHSRIVWDARGYFKPSYFIDKDLGRAIKESWENPFLEKIKSLDYLPLKCKKCNHLKWCKGSSRVIAKLVTGDYFSQDPLIR